MLFLAYLSFKYLSVIHLFINYLIIHLAIFHFLFRYLSAIYHSIYLPFLTNQFIIWFVLPSSIYHLICLSSISLSESVAYLFFAFLSFFFYLLSIYFEGMWVAGQSICFCAQEELGGNRIRWHAGNVDLIYGFEIENTLTMYRRY